MLNMDQRKRITLAVYWVVAVSFLLGAITKYQPGVGLFGQDYAAKFADWGYPSWFRFVVGGIEFVCAVMLILPRKRFRFIGAVALVFVLTGAVTTHIVNQDPLAESVAAPINLAILGAIALANWPSDWKELLRPWQTTSVERLHIGLQRASDLKNSDQAQVDHA